MNENARVIYDSAANGSWNMAVDQALLTSAEDQGWTTLRFYTWSEPTLSLGYFQKYQDRQQHRGSLSCPVVRRRSGGGAILHDQELTYSLAVPNSNRWSQRNAAIYDVVHQAIIDQLAKLDIEAELYRDSAHKTPDAAGQGDPGPEADSRFLCFLRRTGGDIVLQDYKIAGSAQRRLKRSLLQHGSLLLKRSNFAAELPGIKEVADKDVCSLELQKQLVSQLEQRLDMQFGADELTDREASSAKQIQESVFTSSNWTRKR